MSNRETSESAEGVVEKAVVFRGIVRKCQHILMTMLDSEKKPRRGMPYTLKAGSRVYENRTDSNGRIDQFVPQTLKKCTLIIDDQEIAIPIEDLAPIEQIKGVQQRLNILGCDCGSPTGEMNEKTKQALRRFQGQHKLPINGKASPETLERLGEVFQQR